VPLAVANYIDGADSALSIDALTAAEVAFGEQTKPKAFRDSLSWRCKYRAISHNSTRPKGVPLAINHLDHLRIALSPARLG